jgi:phospholipase C
MAKSIFRVIVWLTLFTALAANIFPAYAQFHPQVPHFDHIVIIIQENRTPDTLFGDGPAADPQPPATAICAGQNGWASNIDLQNGGPNNYTSGPGITHMGCSGLTQLTRLQFGGASHTNLDWKGQYDHGLMDGACNPTDSGVTCGQSTSPVNPPYIYVQKGTTASPGVVLPYFQIAQSYGWANYMFQTNEGPSYPAHQFLLSGTSAPVWPTEMYADYFVAGNAGIETSGCTQPDSTLQWIDPTGTITTPGALGANIYECYGRNTLVTTQNSAGVVSDRIDKNGTPVTWRYYAQAPGIIWDAPESDPQTCYGLVAAPTGNPACSGTEYSHVIFPGTETGQSAPILTDIQNCNLQEISWVTPDEAWSDHPGEDPASLGPSWVADIVDAIGQSKTNSGGACDYWQASPTAIFIVWDDWGGFYDHVPPPAVYTGTGTSLSFICTAPHGWGCGNVYGFRVPLLVVSPYTRAGTVSGPISTWPPTYPPPACWTHDFGSILAFTEQNFYLPGSRKIAPPGYTYADSNTLDSFCDGRPVVPLWEFFNEEFRAFTPITAQYSASYFENYYNTPAADGTLHTPTGPDDDEP